MVGKAGAAQPLVPLRKPAAAAPPPTARAEGWGSPTAPHYSLVPAGPPRLLDHPPMHPLAAAAAAAAEPATRKLLQGATATAQATATALSNGGNAQAGASAFAQAAGASEWQRLLVGCCHPGTVLARGSGDQPQRCFGT